MNRMASQGGQECDRSFESYSKTQEQCIILAMLEHKRMTGRSIAGIRSPMMREVDSMDTSLHKANWA